MKFKAARSSLATDILQNAGFNACPACGTKVAKAKDHDNCSLCKSDLSHAPGAFQSHKAVIEQDLTDRISDLKTSIRRLKRSLDRQTRELSDVLTSRHALQSTIDATRQQIESEYIQRARRIESKLGGLNERRRFLVKVREMPAEIERRRKEADLLSAKISETQRKIESEESRFKDGSTNANRLASNFKKMLIAIHFPEITETDKILINQRTWMPYIYPDGNEKRAWSFHDAGSGGKMVLFKMCFSLALHLTAAEKDLPIPNLLVIDSPMKNITPDINPDIFQRFYQELYRLLREELSNWQCIIVDQTFFPFEGFEGGTMERKLTKNDPQNPPLISYYRGH